jgi:hypothetical protein
MSSRTFRSGRVAKMTYSETDEPNAAHHGSTVVPDPSRAVEEQGGGNSAHGLQRANQKQNPKSGGMGDETTTPAVKQSQGASSTPIGISWRPRAKPRSAGARIYRTTGSAESLKGLPQNTSPMSPQAQPFGGYTSTDRTQTMGRQSVAQAQKKGTAVIAGRERGFAESGRQVYGQYGMTKTMPPSPQQPTWLAQVQEAAMNGDPSALQMVKTFWSNQGGQELGGRSESSCDLPEQKGASKELERQIETLI